MWEDILKDASASDMEARQSEGEIKRETYGDGDDSNANWDYSNDNSNDNDGDRSFK